MPPPPRVARTRTIRDPPGAVRRELSTGRRILAVVLAIAAWLLWLVAVLMFLAILWVGFAFVRGIGGMRPHERVEAEEVAELDVFFVCAECGTEFQVTKIGELQVPRHCGEPMNVVRRPRQPPLGN